MLVKSKRSSIRRVAVIGAGPAGLVTTKILKENGFNVTVYEKGSEVGGTWLYQNDNDRNFLYKNLHINTSRKLTQFSDFPFDATTQPIPDHRDMAKYLQDYARRFDLCPIIRFKSEVIAVRRQAAAATNDTFYTVRTSGGEQETFQAVAICTGAFTRPAHAESIRAGFQGEYLHSSEYRIPEVYVGKRVCIVGAGNSAVDIASDICTTAAKTVLVARSPVLIMPHFVFGYSIGDISARLQHRDIPAALRRNIIGWLFYSAHGNMTCLGFKPLKQRVHATISSTIVQDIMFGRVAVKQGISSIEGSAITFVDGSQEDFDCIIAATGFVTEFPFLPPELVIHTKPHLNLFKRVLVPGWPGLYFVGMINLDTPINFACERQARWIATIERGGVALPSEEEMLADIAAKRAWVGKTFGPANRHSLQEDSVAYYAELSQVLRQGRRRYAVRNGRFHHSSGGHMTEVPFAPLQSHHEGDYRNE
jgi:dimethylaniline monooxygenase (N-oxide forming)